MLQTLSAEVVFSDDFNYTTNAAFEAEGGWTTWSGGGGSNAGSSIFWGNSAAGTDAVLEYEYRTELAAGETLTMDAVVLRYFANFFQNYSYGMRILLWDGVDPASRTEVAGGSIIGGPNLPQVSYVVTPQNIADGLTQAIFRYSHDVNWGETDSVSFAVNSPPAGWIWNNAAGGSWATVEDWASNGPANGADQTASFNLLDITGDQTVTLDGDYTIGALRFADTAGADGNWILNTGTGGILTLSAPSSGAAPELNVGNQSASINTVLAGTEGLAKSGVGDLILGAPNTYAGDTAINEGSLVLADAAAIPSGTGAGNLSLASNLDLAGFSPTINGLSGAGTVTNSGAEATLTLGAGDADGFAFSGTINDGAGVVNINKIGTGTASLTGVHGLSGSISASGGSLLIASGSNSQLRNVTSITANAGAIVELGSVNMFVENHSTQIDDSRVLRAEGGTLLMNTAMDSRIGNVELANGATWTIDRGLNAWDVLLANVTTGPATVSVANSIDNTAPSTLDGLGGLHLQGIQNFDVADVTGDASEDFVVEIPLGNPGNAGGDVGGINKLGEGTLLLRGVNEYTGDTIVSAGSLALEEFASLTFVIGENGVNNSISGDGTVFIDGDFDIDLTAADATSGNSWTLVEAANRSFGPGFFVPGFTEVDDVHTLEDGSTVWTFTEATATLTVQSGLNFDAWAASNAGGQGPSADFDGDGTANGIEFFMGETGSSFTTQPGLVSGTITWPRNPEANLSYVIETSTNLKDEVTPGDGGWATATEGVVDNGDSVSFTPPTDAPSFFVRLRVTIP